jgi:hypothetical protein
MKISPGKFFQFEEKEVQAGNILYNYWSTLFYQDVTDADTSS